MSKRVTERQRKELRRIANRGYFSGGIIGYTIYQKLLERGYLRLQPVETETKEGEYLVGIIKGTEMRDVLTDKGRKAVQP